MLEYSIYRVVLLPEEKVMKAGTKSPTQKTKHHKVPRSRCIDGVSQPDNIAKIERCYHEAWHTLFSNRTPFEIVVLLIEKVFPHGMVKSASIRVMWQGRTEEYSYFYRESHPLFEPWNLDRPAASEAWALLFGSRSLYSVLNELLTASRWSPRGYFTMVQVVVKDHGTIELGFCKED